MKDESMLGKWDGWYKNVKDMGSFRYGDTITYQLATDFLKDMNEVEDWGSGTGGFKRLYKGKYIGVDGSANPFVDKIADLREYRSNVDGIMMRHVLEHNYDWEKVLSGALASFRKKFCLIIFTPFKDTTQEIAHNKKHGVDVPDIAFAKKDIEDYFKGLNWRMEEHKTKTGYGIEYIYYIEKFTPLEVSPKLNNQNKDNIKIEQEKDTKLQGLEKLSNGAPKVAVISANLGGLDTIKENVPQSISNDTFIFTDENFPPRLKAMTPRLQAKIPKCFGWEMAPGYEYYLWIDSTLSLPHPDSIKFFYDKCQGYDIVVFKHPSRPDIRQEARFINKGLNQKGRNPGSKYIIARYENELVKEMYNVIQADKEFKDDLLVNGGIFIYRNTPKVQQMLKDWWYYISRYIIQDQISFPYVLKKNGLKINVLPEVFSESPYLSYKGHKYNSK